ncbi:MAG: NADP-dependent oxidoreductase [Catenulispora sp.]|nr:NADP-dependent oxidoreductase [Catenulispora sp.]
MSKAVRKAVVFTEYGGPDVLHVAGIDVPEPAAGQVRVRIKAAGVQPVDALFRSGAAARWLPAAFPQQLGNEFAGVIESVGPAVAGSSLGDEVIGFQPNSCYAEAVTVPADHLAAKPAAMPWPEAGVLSASGQTASTALEDLGVGPGDTVLIHAAAGGVGTFAVQLAVAAGATVLGTASERNHPFLRDLGAIPVTYGEGLTERIRAAAPGGVDASLDAAGTPEAAAAALALVADPHRIGTTVPRAAMAEPRIRSLSTRRSAQRLAALVALYEAGSLKIFIDRTYRLHEAADAHRAIETGHVRGKIAIVP